jgi:uncharacterized coiled-coil protein SlyX
MKGDFIMFENVSFVVVFLLLITFQITSIVSLNSQLKKNNSFLEKRDYELEKLFKSLENKTQSTMVDKKSDK